MCVCASVRFINTYAYEARHNGAQWGTRRALFLFTCEMNIFPGKFSLPLPPIDGTCSTTCLCVARLTSCCCLFFYCCSCQCCCCCCFEIAVTVAVAGCQVRVLSIDTVLPLLLLLPPFPLLSIFCCAVRGDNCRSAAAAAAYVALSLPLPRTHTLVSLSSLLCS